MINEEELISNVEERIAYDNSMKDYSRIKSIKRKVITTIFSLVIVCALTFVVDAASGGTLSTKFKSYFYNADGTKEELPVNVEIDENGNTVYKFEKEFVQNGQNLTVVGEYYDHDGKMEFGATSVLNEDGTVSDDAVIITYFAKDEIDAAEFEKYFNELSEISNEE